jgi:hypothetical protein
MAKSKSKPSGKTRGRPTKRRPDDRARVYELARDGKTLDEMAAELGIARSTLCAWGESDKEFSDAIRSGKKIADDQVERSLFERATGYEHPEEKIFLGKDGEAVVVPTVKRYPPDTVAGIFWLKPRRRVGV